MDYAKGGSKNSNNKNASNVVVVGAAGVVDVGPHIYNNVLSNGNVSGEANVRGGSGEIENLRDVLSHILTKPVTTDSLVAAGICPYEHIVGMMQGLSLQDDGIMMNHKIKAIEVDFCNLVHDENMLRDSMEYINQRALMDQDTAMKFAMLFSSRNFDMLAMKDIKVRSLMLKLLETNFFNADAYRLNDKNRLYNSITLLGEYYNRVRLANNTPITILGESLISLLLREISETEENGTVINTKLAKLILSQITLNGDLLRTRHIENLTKLLYHIRRNLIEQPALTATVKALLLMTLDLYYNNFSNLGVQLEKMYTQYVIQSEAEENEGNNNSMEMPNPQPHMEQNSYSPQQQQTHLLQDQFNQTPTNSDLASSINEAYESPTTTKKWSEQVCEDSLFAETEFDSYANSSAHVESQQSNSLESYAHNTTEEQDEERDWVTEQPQTQTQEKYIKPKNRNNHNNRNYHQQKTPPPPQQKENAEEEPKPLPRWREPRFNREAGNQQNGYQGGRQNQRNRNNERRFSQDDDSTARSEGGSIRLYSVNDRLKHSQEKNDRNDSNYCSFNYTNSNWNWDRQSQRDDRSERSYASNYERGNVNRRNGGVGGHNNSRNYNKGYNTYNKPPRFQKKELNENQRQQDNEHMFRERKIHSESWRRSHTPQSGGGGGGAGGAGGFPDVEEHANNQNSPRARTLPRPRKTSLDTNSQDFGGQNRHVRGGGGGVGAGGKQNYNERYNSQNSLHSWHSDASNTMDRRRNYRGPRNHQNQQQNHNKYKNRSNEQNSIESNEPDWDVDESSSSAAAAKDNNEQELVRNARQTTKYMNYLSSK